MRMPAPLVVPASLLLLLAAPIAAIAFASSRAREATPLRADVARGRYLVEQVGLCADCHSPRGDRGELLADRWLMGAGLPFRPTVPMPWADAAPPIAGLPTLPDDAMALHFLTTGELPGGRRPRPPMPAFRFSPEDARDVLAYLRNPPRSAPGQPVAEAGR